MSHPRNRDDQRRPRGRPDTPTDYRPLPTQHPTGRQAFAACDLHLPDLLRTAHEEDRTLRWRVSHLEQADPTYMCHCLVPGHWFFLEIPEESTT